MTQQQLSPRQFILTALNMAGVGLVLALIPNAVLGTILKPLAASSTHIALFLKVLAQFQSTASFLLGAAVAMGLGLPLMKTILIGGATFVASGVLVSANLFDAAGNPVTVLQLKGIGDLINAILVATASTYVFKRISGFGSLNVIVMPILAAIFAFVGLEILPLVAQITQAVADLVDSFTNLAPMLTAILIGATFAVIITSPLSTVVIAVAVQLTGFNAGAANVGICATFALFCHGGWKHNPWGVRLACGVFGSVKMMVENIFRTPLLNLTSFVSGAIAGLGAYLLNVQGNPFSAGFGYSGLVGPFAAFEAYTKQPETVPFLGVYPSLIVAYIVIPWVGSYLVNFVATKVLRLYDSTAFAWKGTGN